jgi:hypothetical protein
VRPARRDAIGAALSGQYDLITIFEALHDMNHPVEALRTARNHLAGGGCVIVADERVADRFAPPGDALERLNYARLTTSKMTMERFGPGLQDWQQVAGRVELAGAVERQGRTTMTRSSLVLLALAIGLAASGCSDESQEATCVGNEGVCAGSSTCDPDTGRCVATNPDGCNDVAVCGTGTTCDRTTGRCLADEVGADCRNDAAICESGTSCDGTTGRCVADPVDCSDDATLCAAGTSCDGTTGRCVADPVDCTDDATICEAGTACDETTGRCVADEVDCRDDGSLCGTGTRCDTATGLCMPDVDCILDATLCGVGALCGADGVCRADCRNDLARTCGIGLLCDGRTGVCQSAAALDCTVLPALCWEDQVCDAPTGYCREASVDSDLAYDVQLYDLTIDLLTATQTFEATVNVYLLATADDTSAIALDVGTESDVGGTMHNPYTVTAVADSAGTALAFSQNATTGVLSVTLGAALATGEGEVLRIAYEGAFNPIDDPDDPLFYAGLMQREGADDNPIVMTFGWPDYTRRWLPSHDHPSDGARFIVDVGIDDDSTVLSNGVLVSESAAAGLNRRTFVLRQPVPTYALSIIAADYVQVHLGVVDGVSVDAYVYPADASVPAVWWADTVGALRYLDTVLGAYPHESYGLVEFPSIFGGMEHATMVAISDAVIRSASPAHGARTVVHELIHHWWGDNARQARWEEFWLNESLATFFEADHRRVSTGTSAYQFALDDSKRIIFRYPFFFDGYPLRYSFAEETVPNGGDSTFMAPYYKGLWFWHMLRIQMDEPTFYLVMRTFYEATRFGTYDTETLLATVNSVTGADFGGFFDEWVYQAGWPKIRYTWSYDAEAGTVTVDVSQVQDTAAYGTYTFAGALALNFVADDGVTATPACPVTVMMTGGATTASATASCASPPTTVTTPFTSKLLVQIL